MLNPLFFKKVAILKYSLLNDIGLFSPKLVVKQILYHEIVFTMIGIMDWKYFLREIFWFQREIQNKTKTLCIKYSIAFWKLTLHRTKIM